MNASELRIGNIVKDDDVTYIVSGIEKRHHQEVVYVDGNIFSPIALSTFSPVPLTEEWLLKFGYAQNKTVADMFEDETRLNIWRSPNDFNGFIADWDALTLRYIEYVHQLQNLYFTLTGEELTLKS